MELLEERQTRGFERAGLNCGIDKRILFLAPLDRKLLELTVSGTLTRRQAGALVGLSSGTVTRRVRRLLDRLNNPLVVALVDYGQLLPELHREVGLAYFLRKRSFAQIAVEFGLSRYMAKQMVQHVRWWHEASRATNGRGAGKR
jgi:hypothetical protein